MTGPAVPRFSSQALLPAAVRDRLQHHYRQQETVLRRFRLVVQAAFQDEVERLCRSFAGGPLRPQAEPVAEALHAYVSWFGWCVWCCSHLAPPLGLTGAPDARRLAAALLVYCGPRLIDDAIDDHRSYKDKRATTLAGLAAAFPGTPDGALRGHTALLGSWLIMHGLTRLARHGGRDAVDGTVRLCAQIAPGAVIEGLHPEPLSWPQYREVVRLKAVRYDQILYRNLVDPVPEPLRGRVLGLAERMSALAQYLNDFVDRGDDLGAGRSNLLHWFPDEDGFWALCRDEAGAIGAELDSLPPALGNAFAAALVETIDAAARISARTGGPTGSRNA
ncbi:hypothetical protein [Azospirillum argentinense]